MIPLGKATKTQVFLMTPQGRPGTRQTDRDRLALVRERIQFWFGGAEFCGEPLNAQVFVFVTHTKSVPVLMRCAAQSFFWRSKTEALVYEYDVKADTFIARSQTWMDQHADY